MRGAALILLALASVGAFAACGDGNDEDAPAKANTAAELIPDLSGAGFALGETGRVPGATSNQDAHYAVYGGPGAVGSIRVEVNMHADVEAAAKQYGSIAEALRNPPPDLFGPNATQQEGAAVYQGDESRSYVTTKADPQGNLVYTDAYRFGRVVAIVYAISNDAEAVAKVRKEIAAGMAAKAPR